MWCNSWELKEVIGQIIKIISVCGAIYLGLYAFAKVTYKIHKIKNK